MSAKISDLQERQIINIADGRCLGDIKDIELNLREGTIHALVLPGCGGFRGFLQNQSEILVPWHKVIRIGVDVVLVDMPGLAEAGARTGPRMRRRRKEEPAWQQELDAWKQELNAWKQELNAGREEWKQGTVIVLPPEQKEGF